MDALRITGGAPLSGTVHASGAKNSALPIMAAATLADGPVTLERVPDLLDVRTLSRLLSQLGVSVCRESSGALRLENVDTAPVRADARLVSRMRASFCVLGPLLARRRRAIVPLPGGCAIGDRPVDLHLAGLAALGADIHITRGHVVAEARRLRGAIIHMAGPRGPTVTGTANVMSAATLARGSTVITGAATEPEIVDLGQFLIVLGARIEGLGTPTIEIHGVDQLSGGRRRLIPDRIEAATLLCAGAITGGSVTVRSAHAGHMTAILDVLRGMGAQIDVDEDAISLRAGAVLRPINVIARPYPAIPTDLQSQLTALAALCCGESRIDDRVFPARFHHVRELARLGAEIRHTSRGAVVRGVARLFGARVTATDLRASAALVLAGLAADGMTMVERVGHLDRGYERLEEKLRALGAEVERVESRRFPVDRAENPLLSTNVSPVA
jgi:UDP-N-acetylglucosamine 1-carboxyvinyltransferase